MLWNRGNMRPAGDNRDIGMFFLYEFNDLIMGHHLVGAQAHSDSVRLVLLDSRIYLQKPVLLIDIHPYIVPFATVLPEPRNERNNGVLMRYEMKIPLHPVIS